MNPSENVAVHGESIHLPPMWPGVKSRPQRHIMWVEFVVASVAFFPRGFSPGTPALTTPQKSTFLNFNSTKKGRRRATMWMCYL